jgi:hypothetical protein
MILYIRIHMLSRGYGQPEHGEAEARGQDDGEPLHYIYAKKRGIRDQTCKPLDRGLRVPGRGSLASTTNSYVPLDAVDEIGAGSLIRVAVERDNQ